MSVTSPFHRPHHFYQALPKVDLHRHLEGSLRLTTLVEIARAGKPQAPEGSGLNALVQVGDIDQRLSQHSFSKPQNLSRFFCSPEMIVRLAYEAVADAACDQVRYLELRFNPGVLAQPRGFELGEVMDWVIAGARQAEADFRIQTRLVASLNHRESPRSAMKVARLAADRLEYGVVGLELPAGEASFGEARYGIGRAGISRFGGLFREARQAGLHLVMHSGEQHSAEGMRAAILLLGVDRVSPGLHLLEDPDLVALLRERQIPVEVCLTSSVRSGHIKSLEMHPLPGMLQQGLNIVLGSDHPSLADIGLSGEYWLACERMGVSLNVIEERIRAAARAAFIPLPQSTFLVARITAELAACRAARSIQPGPWAQIQPVYQPR